jgi:hypothetical protein
MGISNMSTIVKERNPQGRIIKVEGQSLRDGYKILQLRIRWTIPEYNDNVDKAKGTYLQACADQMREYPGYVYHCHILPQ